MCSLEVLDAGGGEGTEVAGEGAFVCTKGGEALLELQHGGALGANAEIGGEGVCDGGGW